MKKINNIILQNITNPFNTEILTDPLLLSYYTALQNYNDCLMNETDYQMIKYYTKDLLKIMKTDAHVVYLLLNLLHIDNDIYCEVKFYSNTSSETYWYKQLEVPRLISRTEDETKFVKVITMNKHEMSVYILNLIETLFPSVVFSNYKTTRLKEILKLLSMKVDIKQKGLTYEEAFFITKEGMYSDYNNKLSIYDTKTKK